MSYISLYRKYRSQTFDEILGQEHITKTLKNAIQKGRIAHAYLFSGPRGTGKTSTARILAKAINCETGPTPVPCNKCSACTGITSENVLDIIEIDAASNRGIDDIRELREKVRFPPSQFRRKVYIIDEVHMLTKEAVNALLKTLEEPPDYIVFVLATTEPHKLLPTILSRCQRYDFRRIAENNIAEQLQMISAKENIALSEETLKLVVKSADGALRDAISLLDQLIAFSSDNKIVVEDVVQILGMIGKDRIAQFVKALLKNKIADCFKLFDLFSSEGKSYQLFLHALLEYLRNMYFAKQRIDISNLFYMSDTEMEDIKSCADFLDKTKIISLIDEVTKTLEKIRWEMHPRILIEVMIIKIENIVSDIKQGMETIPPAISHQPSAISHQPSTISHQPSAISHQPLVAKKVEQNATDVYSFKEIKEKVSEFQQTSDKTSKAFLSDITYETIIKNWSSVLTLLKSKPDIYYLIVDVIPSEFKDDAVTLIFDMEYHFKQCEERIEIIEASIEKVFGKRIKLVCKLKELSHSEGIEIETLADTKISPQSEVPAKQPVKQPQPMSLEFLLSEKFGEYEEIH